MKKLVFILNPLHVREGTVGQPRAKVPMYICMNHMIKNNYNNKNKTRLQHVLLFNVHID